MNLNKVIIIGRVTKDPEVRKTTSGKSVASFSVATSRTWKDQAGQKQEQSEFHNVVAWDWVADVVGQYLTKGQLCMVEGRLQTRSWDDQAGVKKYRTEIIADNFQLGPRPAGQASGGGSYEPRASEPARPTPATPVDDDEIKIEDIPF